MIITLLISFILFIISLFFSYVCNIMFINPFIFFIIPIILITIIVLILENFVTEKYKITRTLYNTIILQVPAILSIIIALVLWLIVKNEIIIRTFYYASKYVFIPILLIRFIYEIFSKKDKTILISSGFVIGIILGLSFIL